MIPLLMTLALGCPAKEATTSGGDSTDTDTASDTVDTSDSVDTQDTEDTDTVVVGSPPTLSSCDAYCYEHTVGDTFWQWTVNCACDDPDGLDNIWQGLVEIDQSGTLVADYPMVSDGAGTCFTSFKETDDNVLCSQATSYTMTVTVKDWDGNESDAYVVTGRQE